MEGSIASELYGEALQQSSIDSRPTLVADHGLKDEEDNGSDDWYDEDGSYCELESDRIRNQFVTIGYREGLMAGKEASAQDGFNVGFKQSVSSGYKLGFVRGVTSALNCLPEDLKKRLVEKEEERNKSKELHESVRAISTSDALKLFHDEHTRTSDTPKENAKLDRVEIREEGILEKYYKQIQSFVSETPAVEVCVDTIPL